MNKILVDTEYGVVKVTVWKDTANVCNLQYPSDVEETDKNGLEEKAKIGPLTITSVPMNFIVHFKRSGGSYIEVDHCSYVSRRDCTRKTVSFEAKKKVARVCHEILIDTLNKHSRLLKEGSDNEILLDIERLEKEIAAQEKLLNEKKASLKELKGEWLRS